MASPPKPLKAGRIAGTQATRLKVPKVGVRRYVLTSAQNNTPVHKDVWFNLMAMAEYLEAKVLVSRFTYDKSSYGPKSVKPGSGQTSDRDRMWYDPLIAPHVSDERLELAPGLVWCGELNILPTAVDPLSGLETYTGRASAIFPHAKFAMASIASGKHEATKLNYTTGTVTVRNYIKKKAGLKAEHDHCYGAILVEVTPDGSWYVRQLQATPDGGIRDLDLLAIQGEVTGGHRVEAITWGDIHARFLDPAVEQLAWGKGGMADVLKPRFQFIHDVLDFRARNHHEAKSPLALFSKHVRRQESVREEVAEVARFLQSSARDWCQTVVIDSNHDRAMERWLAEADHKVDPVNAVYYLEASLELYRAAERGDRDFHLLEWAVGQAGRPEGVTFLKADDSFVVCRDHDQGVECGMHGDLGPGGARGSIRNFARMGRRTNTGHGHWAGIHSGSWQAGTSSLLDLGYNRGPSNWSHSHIVTYPEGTRSMVTMWNGRWRA